MSKHHNKHQDKPEQEESGSSFADLANALNVDLNQPTEAEAFQEELEQAKQEAAEARDKFVRLSAEMDNLRKRSERDVSNAHRYALEKFVAELLPVLDSMEQGLQVADAGIDGIQAMREGMDMTYKMLLKAVEKFGVVQLNPLNENYDPHQHEAMAIVPAPDAVPNTIVQVIQRGYSLHGRLIRPARVIVSQA